MVVPRPVLRGMMNGGLTTLGPLTIAIVIGIGLLMMLARASNPVDNPGLVTGTLSAMTLAIAVMSVTRHQVRALYLMTWTAGSEFLVVPQWANFAIFVLLLLAGLATVAFMVRRVLASPASGDSAA
jgi:hypothetical protein